MKKPFFDEATLRLGEVLDSRAVVGLGERNLLLAPRALMMSANGATMEAFMELEVLGSVDDLLAGFKKKSRGLHGEHIISTLLTP